MIQINQNAPVTFNDSLLINAPVNIVFNKLVKIQDWPLWFEDIREVEKGVTAEPGKSFLWNNNGTKIRSEIHSMEENKFFGWTGKSMGTKAIHNWYFTSHGNQTQVYVEESMEGLPAVILSGILTKLFKKGTRKWLEALKTACE